MDAGRRGLNSRKECMFGPVYCAEILTFTQAVQGSNARIDRSLSLNMKILIA